MVSADLKNNIINFILFQLVWVGFIYGASQNFIWGGYALLSVMLLWQLWPSRRDFNDIKIIVLCVILGMILDSIWAFSELIQYKVHWPEKLVAPLWILAMWVAFGASINHSLRWIQGNIVIASILSAIGGPVSYLAAERFGAVTISNKWILIPSLSIGWFIVMAIIIIMLRSSDQQNEGIALNVRY